MVYDVSIDKDLFSVYSEIRLGLLRFHADVKASDDHFWDYMNTEVLPQVRSGIEGKEWSEIPGIKGSRAAYKAFGRNPGRYRVSSESLIRRVRRGDDLYHINSVVDVNNLISVRSGLSVGSYDLCQVHGKIRLRTFWIWRTCSCWRMKKEYSGPPCLILRGRWSQTLQGTFL